MNTWQCDIREDCMAVYRGPRRNSLDTGRADPECVFWKHATWQTLSGWVFAREDVAHAQLTTRLLNELERIADGECTKNGCHRASRIASCVLRQVTGNSNPKGD